MLESAKSRKVIHKEIGHFFKAARISAHISQKDAALAIASTPQYLSNFENGRSTLSLSKVKKLLFFYRVSICTFTKFYMRIIEQQFRNDFSSSENDCQV